MLGLTRTDARKYHGDASANVWTAGHVVALPNVGRNLTGPGKQNLYCGVLCYFLFNLRH